MSLLNGKGFTFWIQKGRLEISLGLRANRGFAAHGIGPMWPFKFNVHAYICILNQKIIDRRINYSHFPYTPPAVVLGRNISNTDVIKGLCF